MLKLILIMTVRDWRAGELRFLLGALALAVASLSAVQFFSDRMGAAMQRDAHGLLGADLVIASERRPLDEAWAARAASLGLRSARTIELESMAVAGEGDAAQARLVSVKAVGADYPLRGTFRLQDGPWQRAAKGAPRRGAAWADPAVLSGLGIAPGAGLRLGEHRLALAGVIAAEPDRGPAALMFAPRVMMSLADLESSGLLQGGSFVTYKLLVAGDAAALAEFERWARARIANGRAVRLDTLASASASSSEALEKGQRFLALVGLLAALLASLAVAMAARRFMLRHADACAMLRCLGLRHAQVLGLYLGQFLLVGLAGSALGVLAGFGAHFLLLEWLGALVSPDLGPVSALPAVRGMAVGVLLLAGFALPPLLQLRDIPHNRLLRGDTGAPRAMTAASYVMGAGMFGLLLVWQAGDLRIGLLTVGAFAAGLALFAAAAWGTVAALRFVPDALGRGVWRLALADLRRRPAAAVTQVVALALGLMALLLLTVVRGDLLAAWRDSAPAGAPNHIAYNIQPDQRDAVAMRMQSYGAPAIYPVMRGRVSAINGKAPSAAAFADKRARNMLEQELAVSAAQALPQANTLVAGTWFGAGLSAPQLSVSQSSAETLGLKLGDRVTLNFAGQPLTATVTSLRQYDLRARHVNFNFILNAEAAQGLPATYVTALHVPLADTRFVDVLVRDFPNLTVVDTGAVVAQLQRMLDQVCAAVEFLFVFTLAAGVLVLYATLVSSQDVRMRQAAVLRAMGASRPQLARAQWIEHALTGSLAGLLAAAGASAGSWALARFAFQLEWHFSPLLWAAGLAAGCACAMLGGWAGLRAVLAQPPLLSLRSI